MPNEKTFSMNRRNFLECTLGATAMLGFSRSTFAMDQFSPSDDRLPDGSHYSSWEQPLKFSKTYYVDNGSTHANDSGPGTAARPFRTINKAAQVLQPGDEEAAVRSPCPR